MDSIYPGLFLMVSSWALFLKMVLLGITGFSGGDVVLVLICRCQHMYH